MASLAQDVDAIIEEEKLGNDSAFEEHEENKDADKSEDTESGSEDDKGESEASSEEHDSSESDEGKEADEGDSEEQKSDEDRSEEKPTDKVEDGPSASDQVAKAKSFMENLNANGYQVLDDKGNTRSFEEVVPPGAYLAAQLSPIKVTDKDGKSHEFLLISDVEKAFPEGFEAKNNIEQLKFERGIMANENKFESAVATYNQAKETYAKEVGEYSSTQQTNASRANEYRAMADKGLVPKIEGDTNDPNNAAVKELDRILEFMNSKNEELAKDGMGKIDSLWVAKQLMDREEKADETKDKAKNIDQQRKAVASLSSTPTAGNDKGTDKKPDYSSLPMNQFAEQLIAQEGLK